ncbi:MAG TPA: CoA ester lyase [Streptosporangiaceae bacterium]|jgi:citrate lyase subunit beta/citryl-CoA lyase
MTSGDRPRRSCLTVPGSSERFLAKARSLAPDELILDLEDAVAPAAKEVARTLVIEALATEEGWTAPLRAVRVNDALSKWAHRDVIEVVERAGDKIDAIVLPKVSAPAHVIWLDLLLGQAERQAGLPLGRIAIEAQIEDAAGLVAVEQIATASPRLAALIFGPADFMASVGMRSLAIGARPQGYKGDAFHYVHLRLLMAARAAGLQAIDGPYAAISDLTGLQADAASIAALGFDGKWVVHPSQIDLVNAAFAPDQDSYDRAEQIIDAYGHATTQQRGAVMLDGEMIDEATRKLALVTAGRGRAAGMVTTSQNVPGQ